MALIFKKSSPNSIKAKMRIAVGITGCLQIKFGMKFKAVALQKKRPILQWSVF